MGISIGVWGRRGEPRFGKRRWFVDVEYSFLMAFVRSDSAPTGSG
jgi:hypothetical protein